MPTILDFMKETNKRSRDVFIDENKDLVLDESVDNDDANIKTIVYKNNIDMNFKPLYGRNTLSYDDLNNFKLEKNANIRYKRIKLIKNEVILNKLFEDIKIN